MRIWLYILAGITSALIGWNIGQIFLTDLKILSRFPEVVLFPCVAISLAIGMVMNEIFISNPTRPKLNFRIALVPLLIATLIGLIAGLAAGGIFQLLIRSGVAEFPGRLLGWLFVGAAVGLAEGLTWQFYSMEAGDRDRFRQRLYTSIIGAGVASLVAVGIFEFIRQWLGTSEAFRKAEDPLGFAILGLLLGLTFTITNSPSYMAALRAGKGFEYRKIIPELESIDPQFTSINSVFPNIHKTLKFVSESDAEKIEEGLSIQLPAKGIIKIGSVPKTKGSDGVERGSDIYLPGLPPHIADIKIISRDAILDPNPTFYNLIELNGRRLTSTKEITLKHNNLITFHVKDNHNPDEPKIYRFVFYNRFLDPQA